MCNKTKAVIFMLLSALAFALMSVFIRLTGDLPTTEKVFFRLVISSVIVFFMLLKAKLPILGKKWNQKLLIARSVFGLLGILLYFYGINYIYLADAAMLSRLNPFFVSFFAWFFLKEKLPPFQLIALLLVFLSSLLIIKPSFNLNLMPTLAIVGAAALTGGSHTIIRALKFKEHPLTIVFYFSFVSMLVLIPFVIINFQMPTTEQWFYLLGIGIFGVISQIFLTHAYRYAKASEISIYSYSTIIFASVLGFIFWKEVSDLMSIIGGIIIIGISVLLFIKQRNIT